MGNQVSVQKSEEWANEKWELMNMARLVPSVPSNLFFSLACFDCAWFC